MNWITLIVVGLIVTAEALNQSAGDLSEYGVEAVGGRRRTQHFSHSEEWLFDAVIESMVSAVDKQEITLFIIYEEMWKWLTDQHMSAALSLFTMPSFPKLILSWSKIYCFQHLTVSLIALLPQVDHEMNSLLSFGESQYFLVTLSMSLMAIDVTSYANPFRHFSM
jgi:hypothetical protein